MSRLLDRPNADLDPKDALARAGRPFAATADRPGPAPRPAEEATPRRAPVALGLARIGLGFLFVWAFVDKLVGLGFSTPAAQGWLDGGNPTKGYLASAEGPLAGLYHSMAGGALTNVLFMAGLLAVGTALMAGVASRLATVGGVAMVLLMWSTHLLPETNPVLDEHLIYALVLVGLLAIRADRTLGLGDRWSRLQLVRRVPILR
jgi:thiosulfate dehydrogenase [quinone] large subunit